MKEKENWGHGGGSFRHNFTMQKLPSKLYMLQNMRNNDNELAFTLLKFWLEHQLDSIKKIRTGKPRDTWSWAYQTKVQSVGRALKKKKKWKEGHKTKSCEGFFPESMGTADVIMIGCLRDYSWQSVSLRSFLKICGLACIGKIQSHSLVCISKIQICVYQKLRSVV